MNLKLLHDDVIKNVADDQFGHRIYANTLKSIIEAESPGVISVGLFGKWGQGKSSIVELLREGLNPNITPVVFNAWQVRGDRSIRRQLILELIDKTCSHKVYDQISAYSHTCIPLSCLTEDEQNRRHRDAVIALFTKIKTPSWVVMVAILAGILFLITIGLVCMALFGGSRDDLLLDSIPYAFGAFSATITALWGWIKTTKGNILLPDPVSENEKLRHPEQFLRLFKEHIGSQYINTKSLLVVVDDLDRCSAETVAEALASIHQLKSYCLKHHINCSFLIPCDEDQVVKALESDGHDHSASASYHAELLRKFFDVTVRMDAFVDEDMVRYVDQVAAACKDIIASEDVQPLRELIGAVGPSDPRQVKKLINAYLVAKHKYEQQLAAGGIPSPEKMVESENTFRAVVALRETTPKFYAKILSNIEFWNKPLEAGAAADSTPGCEDEIKRAAQILDRLSPTDASTALWLMNTGLPKELVGVDNAYELVESYRHDIADVFVDAIGQLQSDNVQKTVAAWLLKRKSFVQSVSQLKPALNCLILAFYTHRSPWLCQILEQYLEGQFTKDALLEHEALPKLTSYLSDLSEKRSKHINEIVVSNLARVKDIGTSPELESVFFILNTLTPKQKVVVQRSIASLLGSDDPEDWVYSNKTASGFVEKVQLLYSLMHLAPRRAYFGSLPKVAEMLVHVPAQVFVEERSVNDLFSFIVPSFTGKSSSSAAAIINSLISEVLKTPQNISSLPSQSQIGIRDVLRTIVRLIPLVKVSDIDDVNRNALAGWVKAQAVDSAMDVYLVLKALSQLLPHTPTAQYNIALTYLEQLTTQHNAARWTIAFVKRIDSLDTEKENNDAKSSLIKPLFLKVTDRVKSSTDLSDGTIEFFMRIQKEALDFSDEADTLLAWAIHQGRLSGSNMRKWIDTLAPLSKGNREQTKEALFSRLNTCNNLDLYIPVTRHITSPSRISIEFAKALAEGIRHDSTTANQSIELQELLSKKIDGCERILEEVVDHLAENPAGYLSFCVSHSNLLNEDRQYVLLDCIYNSYLVDQNVTHFKTAVGWLADISATLPKIVEKLKELSKEFDEQLDDKLRSELKNVLKKRVLRISGD